jgi:hypothetical protein
MQHISKLIILSHFYDEECEYDGHTLFIPNIRLDTHRVNHPDIIVVGTNIRMIAATINNEEYNSLQSIYNRFKKPILDKQVNHLNFTNYHSNIV